MSHAIIVKGPRRLCARVTWKKNLKNILTDSQRGWQTMTQI